MGDEGKLPEPTVSNPKSSKDSKEKRLAFRIAPELLAFRRVAQGNAQS
jgi:hypothetical protein